MSNRMIHIDNSKRNCKFVRDWRTLPGFDCIIAHISSPITALPLLLESEAAELDALELQIIWQGDYSAELKRHSMKAILNLHLSPCR